MAKALRSTLPNIYTLNRLPTIWSEAFESGDEKTYRTRLGHRRARQGHDERTIPTFESLSFPRQQGCPELAGWR